MVCRNNYDVQFVDTLTDFERIRFVLVTNGNGNDIWLCKVGTRFTVFQNAVRNSIRELCYNLIPLLYLAIIGLYSIILRFVFLIKRINSDRVIKHCGS